MEWTRGEWQVVLTFRSVPLRCVVVILSSPAHAQTPVCGQSVDQQQGVGYCQWSYCAHSTSPIILLPPLHFKNDLNGSPISPAALPHPTPRSRNKVQSPGGQSGPTMANSGALIRIWGAHYLNS